MTQQTFRQTICLCFSDVKCKQLWTKDIGISYLIVYTIQTSFTKCLYLNSRSYTGAVEIKEV